MILMYNCGFFRSRIGLKLISTNDKILAYETRHIWLHFILLVFHITDKTRNCIQKQEIVFKTRNCIQNKKLNSKTRN